MIRSLRSGLMVTHGGYDNSDVNKDINCMFPSQTYTQVTYRTTHAGFMGGGGNIEKFTNGNKMLKDEGADAAIPRLMRNPHRLQQSCREQLRPTNSYYRSTSTSCKTGWISTRLPNRTYGCYGAPHDVEMQTAIVKSTLFRDKSRKIVPLPYEITAVI